MQIRRVALIVAALGAGAFCSVAGPLDPPSGPIAPTMKTLSEVEPRIAVNDVNTPGNAIFQFRITKPGSYYLTGDITGVAGKNAVWISADNVTLDLNSFAVIGVPGSGSAIVGTGGSTQHNVTVRNGVVRDWPNTGISLNPGEFSVIEDLQVHNCSGHGLSLGASCRVSRCIMHDIVGNGVFVGYFSIVSDCVLRDTGKGWPQQGIYAFDDTVIQRCAITSSGLQGIYMGDRCRLIDCLIGNNAAAGVTTGAAAFISGCIITNNTGDGITLGEGSTVQSCTCLGNSDDGIQASSNCFITDNRCENNGASASGAGVYVVGNATRVENNHLTGNRYGVLINASGADNFVVKNTARNNAGGNFSVSAGNEMAPVITNPGLNSFATMTPWSNVAY